MDDQTPRPVMDPRTRNEKEEKDEKDQRDRQEKEEKGASDRPGTVSWALVLIMAGLFLLASNLGLIPQGDDSVTVGVILMGAGVIVALEVLFRYLRPEYRRPLGGRLVLAVVLFGLGAGSGLGWENTWPVVLIGIGIAILVGTITRR